MNVNNHDFFHVNICYVIQVTINKILEGEQNISQKKINFMNNYSYGDLVIRKKLLTLNLFKLNEKNHDY
jgi:hypothetical protein